LTIAFFLSIVVSSVLTGCEIASRESAQGASDVLALSIEKEIMCPVCPGETIDQSQVHLAKQMRELIRLKIAEGESRREILDYFVERYGPSILAEPRKSGSSLLVWLVPPSAVLAGAGVLALMLRKMMVSRPEESEWDERNEEEDVERFLDIVDARLEKKPDDERVG
jgi:cytochrome c-type biogenesis protein CcmH